MMRIDERLLLRDLLTEYPQTRKVFEQYEIDYCCGGLHNLGTAAELAGIPLNPLVDALKCSVADRNHGERNWADASVTELADHIAKAHHAFLRDELPRLHALIDKVQAAHQRHDVMLSALKCEFARLECELVQHLDNEDTNVFPLIRQMDAISRNGGKLAAKASMRELTGPLETEHETAGLALDSIREITSDFTLPEDACIAFRSMMESLKEFERDLHEHIHLENNILFPAAAALEKAAKR